MSAKKNDSKALTQQSAFQFEHSESNPCTFPSAVTLSEAQSDTNRVAAHSQAHIAMNNAMDDNTSISGEAIASRQGTMVPTHSIEAQTGTMEFRCRGKAS